MNILIENANRSIIGSSLLGPVDTSTAAKEKAARKLSREFDKKAHCVLKKIEDKTRRMNTIINKMLRTRSYTIQYMKNSNNNRGCIWVRAYEGEEVVRVQCYNFTDVRRLPNIRDRYFEDALYSGVDYETRFSTPLSMSKGPNEYYAKLLIRRITRLQSRLKNAYNNDSLAMCSTKDVRKLLALIKSMQSMTRYGFWAGSGVLLSNKVSKFALRGIHAADRRYDADRVNEVVTACNLFSALGVLALADALVSVRKHVKGLTDFKCYDAEGNEYQRIN